MNNINKLESVKNIKEALIKSCVKSRPSYLKPFLLSSKVSTECSDIESFYKFFKLMISNSRKMSEGKIHLRVELKDENKSLYNFYDSIHIHPRLTVVVIEQNDNLHIDILPF
jgi:hypothetical protein